MNFLDILAAVIPFFLVIGLGCITRIAGILNSDAEKSVMNLVLWLLYPCFILWKVPGNESLQDVSVVGVAIGAGFSLTVVAFSLAWMMGWLSRVSIAEGRNTFAVSTGLQNYGFIPIPLVMALFGARADETLGVLFVHNLGVEIALWTVGLVIISGQSKDAWKRLINGPTIAIAIGLTLNFAGELFPDTSQLVEPIQPSQRMLWFYDWVLGIVHQAVAQLGICAIPTSLILVGASLAGVVQSEKWQTKWNVISGAMAFRFAIMPTITLCVAAAVSFSPSLQQVLIVQAAMPAAVFPVVLAKHFGGKPGVAAQITIATSLASLLLTPAILSLAMKFFGVEL